MLTVHLNSTTVEAFIASSSDFSSLTVACYSSPTDCVVLGPLEHLPSLKAILKAQAKCSLLDIAFGYHGPAMDIELRSKLQVVFLSVRGLSCCRTTAEIVAEITRPSQRILISPLSPSVTSSSQTLVAERQTCRSFSFQL